MKDGRKFPLLLAPAVLALASCGLLGEEKSVDAAESALAENDFASARVHLAKALGETPDDHAARLKYAETLLNLGDGVGAQSALEQLPPATVEQGRPLALLAHSKLLQGESEQALDLAMRSDSSNPLALWVRVGAMLSEGMEKEAFAQIESAIAEHPSHARLLALAGEMELTKRQVEKAKVLSSRALQADSASLEANTLAGKIALLKSDYALAENHFAAAVKANPSTPGPYLSLAAVQADLGKLDVAEATIGKASEIAPDHPMANFLTAKLAFVGGDLNQAHQILQDSEAILRNVPAAQLLQGEIAHLRGSHEQAIAFLRPFMRDNPLHVQGATVMAQALLAVGDSDKAWAVIERPASRASANASLLAMASRLAQQTGREDVFAARLKKEAGPKDAGERLAQAGEAMAERDWNRARMLYSGLRRDGLQGNALILNNSAIAELNAGNSAQALQLARQAAALTPEDPQVMDTMGWVLLQAGGDKAEALAWLTRAVDTLPGNLEIRWHYAAGLAANGRKADARNIIGGVREFANAEQRARIDELLASL